MRAFQITTHCLDTKSPREDTKEKVDLKWNERVVVLGVGVRGSSIVCGEETGAGTIPKGVAYSFLNYCLFNVPLFVLLGSLPVKISEEVSVHTTKPHEVTYLATLHSMILVDCHIYIL